jgi:transcriptional antiterminator NusG
MNMSDETEVQPGDEAADRVEEKQVQNDQVDQNETTSAAEAEEAVVEEIAEPVVNQNPNMRWYVVQAFSGYEKKVMASLQEHVERAGKQEAFGRILVPTEEVVEMKGGQKRTSERKFFPGYVLVQMEMTDENWHLVKGVPRVAGFIGGVDNRPVPITDKEANEIIQQVSDSADKPKMKFTFAPGEIVRIVEGPFQDFNGTVEDANFEKAKLKVSVTIFGRSTPVELDFTQVEKG